MIVSAITFEILVVLLLVFCNGVFAMSEMAVISGRKARLQQWANTGDAKARAALALANAPNHQGTQVRVFEETERKMVESVFRLRQVYNSQTFPGLQARSSTGLLPPLQIPFVPCSGEKELRLYSSLSCS